MDAKLYIDEEANEPNEGERQKNYSNSTLKLISDWLHSQYEFKRDIIKTRIIFRPLNSNKQFRVLEDPQLNTMCVNADFSGLKQAKPATVMMYLSSEHIPPYDAIVEYLERVGKNRVTGKIDQLCSCIKTNNDALFKRYFKKWLASSVANALIKRGCQNHTCLVFTGGQGAGKTTFFNWLCPGELSEYMITGEIDLKKVSETTWKLAEYWFINLEEQIKALHKQDANTVKQLITLPTISGRRPYGRLDAHGYRLANFLASTNDEDFLNDPSGSRRFLCFKIESINLAYQKINIDDIWCEAYHFFKDNPNDYFLTSTDIEDLLKNNEAFVYNTQEEEYVSAFFSIPQPKDDYYLMQATSIRDFIKLETGNNNLKDRNIGVALRKRGFEIVSHKFQGSPFSVKAYKVQVISGAHRPSLEKYHAHPNNNFKP